MEKEKLRLDKYLWAIRLFKTRTLASTACEKGRVKINGESLKASRVVRIEDIYEVKTDDKRWIIKVTGLLTARVQYSEAVKHYEDLTPPEEKERVAYEASSFHSGNSL
jgi:ribosome-associated heat shock protein Hsp15